MARRRHRVQRARRQRGAALLTAMIIVTLVATLASSMIWQQWRAVQVEVAERARTQSAWILAGALDWARLILREDARSGRPTALTEPWAVPLAEARLSTFLAADRNNNADDGPEAFLSGVITDAQARYNLANLVGSDAKLVPDEVAVLERLCQSAGVSIEVAARIANGIRDATAPASAGAMRNAPLLPHTVAQLSWFGLDEATLRLLEPYVVLLPAPTPLNVNTASREVLAGAVKGLDLATAERLLQIRQRSPFKTTASITEQVPGVTIDKLTVNSSYFEVRGRLRLTDRVLEERSLVQRLSGGQVVVIHRERVASRESPAA